MTPTKGLSSSRSAVVVMVLSIGILAILALAFGSTTSTPNDPSSTTSGDSGTLALYTWLDKLGYTVHRISGALDVSNTDTLMEIDPIVPLSDDDVNTIMAHLSGGGQLIVTVSPGMTDALLNRLGVQTGVPLGNGTAHNTLPLDAADRVHDIAVQQVVSVSGDSHSVALLDEGSDPVAVAVTVAGGGRAYVIGSAYPMSNLGLRDNDDGPFVLALLERARGGKVGFDEVHHNVAAPDQTLGVGQVFTGPLGLATLGGGLVILLFLGIGGRRLGRAMPRSDPSRVPSATTYVRGVAHLIERSRRRGGIAERYRLELKQRIGAVTGTSPQLDDGAFLTVLAPYGEAETERLRVLLERCTTLAAATPTDRQLVELARQVDQAEREWAQQSQPAGGGAQWRP